MKRHYLSVVLIVMLALLALPSASKTNAVVVARTSVSAQPACSRWSVVKSPNPSNIGDNYLGAVSAISATDIWAVGYYDNSTLTEHWNGSKWKYVPSANVKRNTHELNAAAAISANDVWAVGDHYQGRGFHKTLIEHWNGSKWSIVPSPSPGMDDFLYGVAAVSPKDVWAVGNLGSGQTLIEHWNGSSWSVVPSPSPTSGNELHGITVVSANDIWTVGFDYNNQYIEQTLIEHWNGTQWRVVKSPSPDSQINELYGVTAISAKNVWAVGTYDGYGDSQTLTMHWDGMRWGVVKSPNPNVNDSLSGVAAASATDVWAVGHTSALGYNTDRTLTEHWNGNSWSVVHSPNPGTHDDDLYGVAAISATDVWAVGELSTNYGGYDTLTEHYC